MHGVRCPMASGWLHLSFRVVSSIRLRTVLRSQRVSPVRVERESVCYRSPSVLPCEIVSFFVHSQRVPYRTATLLPSPSQSSQFASFCSPFAHRLIRLMGALFQFRPPNISLQLVADFRVSFSCLGFLP